MGDKSTDKFCYNLKNKAENKKSSKKECQVPDRCLDHRRNDFSPSHNVSLLNWPLRYYRSVRCRNSSLDNPSTSVFL